MVYRTKLVYLLLVGYSIYGYGVDAEKYVIGAWPGGLGVCLHSVLNQIVYCEMNNKVPVIYWDEKSFYYNTNGFNESQNVWEYYFEPVSSLNYKQGDQIHIYYDPIHTKFSYLFVNKDKRIQAFQIIQKYIKIKSTVQKKIDQFYHAYMNNKKTIAIHLRGTDKYLEERKIEPETAVTEALKYADEHTQFLIATDEQKILDRMLQLLKGKAVIYYACYRSEDGKPLHVRKPSFAQLGEDVLVEMSLLAKCDLFIHSASNVSAIVLYLNPYLNDILLK